MLNLLKNLAKYFVGKRHETITKCYGETFKEKPKQVVSPKRTALNCEKVNSPTHPNQVPNAIEAIQAVQLKLDGGTPSDKKPIKKTPVKKESVKIKQEAEKEEPPWRDPLSARVTVMDQGNSRSIRGV